MHSFLSGGDLNLPNPPLATPLLTSVTLRGVYGGIKFLGRYKTSILMFNSRSDVISTHKKFTWTDFVGVYIPIYPRRYAPGNTAL